LKYFPQGAFSLATFALDDSAWLWPNARRDRNRFSSLPNNSRHRPAIRSTIGRAVQKHDFDVSHSAPPQPAAAVHEIPGEAWKATQHLSFD